MASNKSFRVTVDNKMLLKNLDTIKKNYPEVIGAAVRNAALKVASEARKTVVVDKGTLKGSIKAVPDKRTGFSAMGGSIGGYFVWKVGSNLKYAAYIEYGQPTNTGPHGGPRPYLRPAYAKEITPTKMAKRIKQQRMKLIKLRKSK